jgi:hypothetical protein
MRPGQGFQFEAARPRRRAAVGVPLPRRQPRLTTRPELTESPTIALGIVYALTIIAGAIGEWNYYILGSAIEVALLRTIVYYAWTWPKESPRSTTGREVTPHDIQPTAP